MTFCLGFRAWGVDRLERCLGSLAGFGHPIIVTIGDRDLPAWCGTDGRVMGTPATWIHRPMAVWSRAVALNHAVRTARTPSVCLTDADMIVPSHWAPAARRMMHPARLCLTDSRDLPPRTDGDGTDDDLRAISTPHDRVGEGGAMVVSREWFLGVGGFDEAYTVWGCEDTDLVLRARWDGLDVVWLPDTFVAHQWHPRDATPDQWAAVVRNRAYLAERVAEGGPVRRNQG